MRLLFLALLMICVSVGAQENLALQGGPMQKSSTAPGVEGNAVTITSQDAAKSATDAGWASLKQGDADSAVRHFNRAASTNPHSTDAYWGLGVATAQQRKFDVAVRSFERALALDSSNVRLVADAGLAYVRRAVSDGLDPQERDANLKTALQLCDRAEKLDPAYAPLYANRAFALAYLSEYDRAWASIEDAERLDRTSVDPKLVAYLSDKKPRPAPASMARSPASETGKLAPQPEIQLATLPAKQADTAAAPQAEQQSAMEAGSALQKKLKVVGSKPARQQGSDKRNCLDLPSNEEIIRCVYPRR